MEAALAGPESRQLTFEVGGRTPTGSALTIIGGEIEIEGQYEKGQIIEAKVTLEVGEIAFRDKRDSKTGLVVDCKRSHKARVSSLRVERALGTVESDED